MVLTSDTVDGFVQVFKIIKEKMLLFVWETGCSVASLQRFFKTLLNATEHSGNLSPV